MSTTAEAAVIRILKSTTDPMPSGVLQRRASIKAAHLIGMEIRGLVVGELVRTGEAGRPTRYYRLPLRPIDLMQVRAHTVSQGLCNEGDASPVTLPEIRAYDAHLLHQHGLAQAERAREERRAAEVRRQRQRDLLSGWPGKKTGRIRAWAVQQCLGIGVRGPLPSWVVEKYDQEVDDQAELQALLDVLGTETEPRRAVSVPSSKVSGMSDEDLRANLLKIMTETDANTRHRRLTALIEGVTFENSQEKAIALLAFADDDLTDEAVERARQAPMSLFQNWVRERLDLYMTDAELAAIDWAALKKTIVV